MEQRLRKIPASAKRIFSLGYHFIHFISRRSQALFILDGQTQAFSASFTHLSS